MGILEQIDPRVTVASKAVLLQETLLGHLPRPLISVFGHWKRGKNVLLWHVILGNEKEVDVGLG